MEDLQGDTMQTIATPPKEAPTTSKPAAAYAAWLPRDIRYDDAFENSIQEVLEPSSGNGNSSINSSGIEILPAESTQEPEVGVSVRAQDIDTSALPSISLDQLPLPLDHPSRVYASPIPGVRLTHPGGYLEGGPGFAPADDVFAQDFIARFGIVSASQLREVRAREIQLHVEEARRRMRARREALLHNARVEKEIKTLTDQREMEVKIETRMRDEAQTRRERREKRRLKNAG